MLLHRSAKTRQRQCRENAFDIFITNHRTVASLPPPRFVTATNTDRVTFLRLEMNFGYNWTRYARRKALDFPEPRILLARSEWCILASIDLTGEATLENNTESVTNIL